MKHARRPASPVRMPSGFTGFRFPPEVISLAVRWYLRYGLSYRDLEELLAERGVEVDHVTLYRWVQRFTPLLIDTARPVRHLAGDRWFVDETYVKVAGVWSYVYRAVDQYGQVIDVYVSQRRDIASARTFFTAAPSVLTGVLLQWKRAALLYARTSHRVSKKAVQDNSDELFGLDRLRAANTVERETSNFFAVAATAASTEAPFSS